MTHALILAAFLTLTATTEFWSARKLRTASHTTRVASLASTEWHPSKVLVFAGYGLLTAQLAAWLTILIAPVQTALVVPFILAFLCLRLILAHIGALDARNSYLTRVMQALNHPKIKHARIALYFSEPRLTTPFQATMWLKPLLSLNEPFVILLKERKHLDHFPHSDLYEVLVVTGMPSQTAYLPEQTEVLFFVNNSMSNLPVIAANPDVTHVQLLHGDSDKPPSYNPMSAIYDQLFVAGEMAIDRYARHGVRIPREKFRIVGRPQLAAIQTAVPTSSDTKTIVYMSTWSGMFEDSNYGSTHQAPEILQHLLSYGRPTNVIFKPHPLATQDPSWAETENQFMRIAQTAPAGSTVRIAKPDEDPFALYAKADLLISDISSTVIDFLATGKPYIVTNPFAQSAKDLESFPSVAGGYLAAPDLNNLPELITKGLGEDPLNAARKSLRLYAFGDFGSPAGQAFREACSLLLSPTHSQNEVASFDQADDAA